MPCLGGLESHRCQKALLMFTIKQMVFPQSAVHPVRALLIEFQPWCWSLACSACVSPLRSQERAALLSAWAALDTRVCKATLPRRVPPACLRRQVAKRGSPDARAPCAPNACCRRARLCHRGPQLWAAALEWRPKTPLKRVLLLLNGRKLAYVASPTLDFALGPLTWCILLHYDLPVRRAVRSARSCR